MNQLLRWLNLCGVLLLAGICVWQWRVNREANLEAIRLETSRIEKDRELSEQARQLSGVKADLESFRDQVRESSAQLQEIQTKSGRDELQIQRLTGERDQIKESIGQWSAAVAARDAELKQLNTNLQAFAAERNKAVTDFNGLAEKYNSTMSELNTRTKDFNSLVEKYNALSQANAKKRE